MSWARFAKSWEEPHCRACMHTNEAESDGSCSAYGYNGVDCQAQPCTCRTHVITLHQNPQPAADSTQKDNAGKGEDDG